ncbi:MAG: acetylxylan esterase [Tannerellaceae bacterium]|jgi:hypothetical protein|nr:acetylxylan esterase [Tannerellaceae bacterium]
MKSYIVLLVFLLSVSYSLAQEVNYDESKVPHYVLPDVLACSNGEKVTTIRQWEKQRRPEILELFSSQMYGRTPQEKIAVTYETLSENSMDLGGKATSKQVKFKFTNGGKTIEAILLMYIPNRVKGKVPVIVGYNYKGNHSTIPDTAVLYSPSFFLVKQPNDPDWVRGCQSSRWCYEKIIDRGYAVATMCYHDIYPDRHNINPYKESGWDEYSVVSLFSGYKPDSNAPDEWQAIGVWAWGSSRIADYIETQERLDKDKIVLMGHSRQGKAALWAGAQDSRFRIVISNDSGCGGAALSMRVFGENIAQIIRTDWFCPAFNRYADNESHLPFDQHELIALIAPRSVYIASAAEDQWADPKGEFLSLYHATPAYALYGLSGLGTNVPPDLNQPIMHDVGYHIRTGKHDVTDYDWEQFMNFADKHFK